MFLHHAVHLKLGWVGVELFFVLSGFVITRNLLALRDRQDPGRALKSFVWRRLLRIVPPYYLALLLIAGWDGIPEGTLGWYLTFTQNIRDSLYMPHLRSLTSMWSIAIEEQFYLLWPLVILWMAPRRWGALLGVMFAGAALSRLAATELTFHAVYRLPTCRMDLLGGGAALAILEWSRPGWLVAHTSLARGAGVAAAVTFFGCALLIPEFRTQNNTHLFNVLGFACLGLLFASVVAGVSTLREGRVYDVLLHPWVQNIGRVSYAAYLLHVLVIDVLRDLGVAGYWTALPALVLTLLGAELSWRLVEEPLSRYRGLVAPPGEPRAA